MYTIDIDIGSTCTDGFFSSGEEFRLAKVLTTPHDLAECTLACIEAGAQAFDTDLRTFLRDAGVARLSSTLATNLVVQRAGAKIGLIVTRGQERALYGADDLAGVLDIFLPPEMVAAIDEEVDDDGTVVKAAERDDVLDQVRELVGLGARMIVVSLRNAWRNDTNERLVREHVRARYPAQYLRSVPVQLSTEIMHTSDDHVRTNSAVMNAYVHSEMARNLYRIEDRLRDNGARRPLLVVHAHGGSGRIAKTVALQTLHSGPAVATHGAARLAQLMGVPRALTVDMGGTSLDAAVVVDEEVRLRHRPQLEGVELAVPMVEVESIAGGGSSIAHVEEGVVRVGPRSAGSAPGPAAYGRGGMDPTLTDANVVLGFIRPDYFLGGALKLDSSRSERAIERRVATPLGVDVPTAASAIRAALGDEAADKLRSWIEARGLAPEEFTMFVLGGNSALHACLIAERLGIRSLVAFPYCSVFSAFGANTTDVEHRYSRTIEADVATADDVDLVEALTELCEQANRDIVGEGIDPAEAAVVVSLELDGQDGPVWHTLDEVVLAEVDPNVLAEALVERWRSSGGSLASIELDARARLSHWEPSPGATSSDAAAGPVDEREIGWDEVGALKTPVYDEGALRPGLEVDGPALIETAITNYAIAPGWSATIDSWGNLAIDRRP